MADHENATKYLHTLIHAHIYVFAVMYTLVFARLSVQHFGLLLLQMQTDALTHTHTHIQVRWQQLGITCATRASC